MGKNGMVVSLYRVEHFFYTHHCKVLAKIVCGMIRILFSCAIPPSVIIGKNVHFPHGIGIVIHQNSIIGDGTRIYQNVTIGNAGGPKIGKDCIIGCGAAILGDIIIGDNVRIGANAVVLHNLPDNVTAVGVPARIVRERND